MQQVCLEAVTFLWQPEFPCRASGIRQLKVLFQTSRPWSVEWTRWGVTKWAQLRLEWIRLIKAWTGCFFFWYSVGWHASWMTIRVERRFTTVQRERPRDVRTLSGQLETLSNVSRRFSKRTSHDRFNQNLDPPSKDKENNIQSSPVILAPSVG